jgi:hypothetical protein
VSRRSRRELEKALERLRGLVNDSGDDTQKMTCNFRVYELVPDEVSEDNQGELMIQQDITVVDRSDELQP